MTMNKTAKIIGIVVGSLIIVMGLYMLIAAMSTSTGAYFSTTYSIDYSFGADFYTEMYGVTYDAVSQLNKIANGLDAAFDKTLPLLQIIAMGIGMLIIAIGAAVTAFFALSKVAESAPKAEGETSKFSEAMTKVGDTMKSTAKKVSGAVTGLVAKVTKKDAAPAAEEAPAEPAAEIVPEDVVAEEPAPAKAAEEPAAQQPEFAPFFDEAHRRSRRADRPAEEPVEE